MGLWHPGLSLLPWLGAYSDVLKTFLFCSCNVWRICAGVNILVLLFCGFLLKLLPVSQMVKQEQVLAVPQLNVQHFVDIITSPTFPEQASKEWVLQHQTFAVQVTFCAGVP